MKESGDHFDPQVVEVFLPIVRRTFKVKLLKIPPLDMNLYLSAATFTRFTQVFSHSRAS